MTHQARGPRQALALLALLTVVGPASAQSTGDDDDLARIPQPKAPAELATPTTQRFKIEDALTGWANRTAAQPVAHQNRFSANADLRFQVTPALAFALSDRWNVITTDGTPSTRTENNLRELYVAAASAGRTFVDVGRINLKQGVAYGYNPTDVFRAYTAVERSSIDPSAARENRLGVAMVKVQQILDGGSLTFAYAPRSTHEAGSSTNRALLAYSAADLALNPQLSLSHDATGTHWGASLSSVLAASTVGYLEWFGARSVPLALQADPRTREHEAIRSHDVAVGAAWTSSFNLTVNGEFHYHGAGLDSIPSGLSPAQLGLLRRYAGDQQEPLARRELFIRLAWQDVIPSKLNVGMIVFGAPADGSTLTQMSADYFVSRHWTLSGFLGLTSHSRNTFFGGLPWGRSAVIQVTHYF